MRSRDDPFAEELRERLRSVFSSRPWLVATHLDQVTAQVGSAALEAGATDVFGVGMSLGIGAMDISFPLISLGHQIEGSRMDHVRAAQRILGDLPKGVTAEIDRWDPARSARTLGSLVDRERIVAGRRSFGSRPPAWEELEDKLLAIELWRDAGLQIPAMEIVSVADTEELKASHDRLAATGGTVWAGDNSTGWHGGGQSTRWVPDHSDIERVAAELRPSHDRVRVMPFVEGIPCSVHGFVLGAEAIAVFRPSEMVMLRSRATNSFLYAKAAQFWDPAPSDRAAMRSMARRLGALLSERYDYRGVFTVDGVMGVDGFVPTEINPRYGGALPLTIASVDPPINLYLLHLLGVEGLLEDVSATKLERFVVAAHDSNRSGGFLCEVEEAPPSEQQCVAVWSEGTVKIQPPPADGTDPKEPFDGFVIGVLSWGSASTGGGLVRGEYGKDVPIGPPVGPLAAQVISALNTYWPINTPDFEAAIPVR